MKLKKINNLVMAALFSALICLATLLITVGSPIAGGYINLGDCFVFSTIIVLPMGYSMLAAGIGSALADLISGHAIYSPASFVIKALMALVAWLIYSDTKKKFALPEKSYSVSDKKKKANSRKMLLLKIISSFTAEIIMCAGYFAYEALILGYGMGAVTNIPMNAIQAIAGMIFSVILSTAFEKSKIISKFR